MSEQADIVERLRQIRGRIGRMCREGTPPRMSVPALPEDDDLFISDAADQAADEIERLCTALASAEAAALERAAKVAAAHRGSAERRRLEKGIDLSRIPP